MTRKAKPKELAFADHVLSAAAETPRKELSEALSSLVLKRLHTKAIARINRALGGLSVPKGMSAAEAERRIAGRATPTRTRRSARRLGRFRRYTPTTKPDFSRPGTFRTYMISTIRAHTNTRDAQAAHDACTEPKFAKNKLDFNWAADNGYITFD